MRLLVDYSAGFSQGAGIGRYARSVVPAALGLLPDWRVRLLYAAASGTPEPFQEEALAGVILGSQRSVHRIPIARRRLDLLWFRARLPIPTELFTGRCDLVYSPDFTAPPTVFRTPQVVTVHDLAFLIAPEYAPDGLRSFLNTAVPRAARAAARVAVVSETSRRDVIERLGIPVERIALVPNGVDERFFDAKPLSAVRRAALRLPDAYLLTVGTLEPRKNHLTLFRAMRRLRGRVDLPLVVAGRRGWADEAIWAEARELELAGVVRWLDYVPEKDLPGLYAGAAAVVYPSWYEGFGLPVIEAMAAGLPVVTSDAPALLEVGGGTTLIAPAASAEALAAAIETALTPEARSEDATAARIARARCYSWERSGRTLAALLREVGGLIS